MSVISLPGKSEADIYFLSPWQNGDESASATPNGSKIHTSDDSCLFYCLLISSPSSGNCIPTLICSKLLRNSWPRKGLKPCPRYPSLFSFSRNTWTTPTQHKTASLRYCCITKQHTTWINLELNVGHLTWMSHKWFSGCTLAYIPWKRCSQVILRGICQMPKRNGNSMRLVFLICKEHLQILLWIYMANLQIAMYFCVCPICCTSVIHKTPPKKGQQTGTQFTPHFQSKQPPAPEDLCRSSYICF